jgi:hypothetical protein
MRYYPSREDPSVTDNNTDSVLTRRIRKIILSYPADEVHMTNVDVEGRVTDIEKRLTELRTSGFKLIITHWPAILVTALKP